MLSLVKTFECTMYVAFPLISAYHVKMYLYILSCVIINVLLKILILDTLWYACLCIDIANM